MPKAQQRKRRDNDPPTVAAAIGTLNESPLHAALKQHYAQPGDRLEAEVDGYLIDIQRDGLLIEIQTANFAKIARKMRDLSERHRVRLVYPVAQARWIVKLSRNGVWDSRRRSPKRAGVEELFTELVSFPELIAHPNFELEVLLTHEDELRRFDPTRRWRRRGWVTVERRLLDVKEARLIRSPDDLLGIVSSDVPSPFLTSDLAQSIGRSRALAQKAAYCLRKCGAIEQVGKEGNALLYSRRSNSLT